MEKLKLKIAFAALMIAVGSMGLQAQNGKGSNGKGTGSDAGNGTGTCICDATTCTVKLTDEQKAILADLCADYQAEAAVLRTELLTATTLAEKLEIRKAITDLRNAHLAEVKALLTEWGVGGKKFTGGISG